MDKWILVWDQTTLLLCVNWFFINIRRNTCKVFLLIGTKTELLQFKPLNKYQFEVRAHFKNSITDIKIHTWGIIKDGNIVKLEIYENARDVHKRLGKVHELITLIQNMRTHEQVIQWLPTLGMIRLCKILKSCLRTNYAEGHARCEILLLSYWVVWNTAVLSDLIVLAEIST